MKRIISSALAVLLVFCLAAPTFAVKESAGLGEEKIIDIVKALEIMQGDGFGNLNLDNNVTRAEFVKMIVKASIYKDDADVKVAFSTFPDVTPTHWAAGYIHTAVNAKWINGYLDGTFRPSGNVKLEEAVTIVLKLLGYTQEDMAGSYPEVQLAKYRSLKLDEKINAARGAELTRRECMYLIYNLLCTQTKSGASYCTTLGHVADKEGNIDYTALLESKKKGPYVVTELASWASDIGVDSSCKVYKDGKPGSISEIKQSSVLYYSPEFNSVWVYDDKQPGILEKLIYTNDVLSSIVVSGKTHEVVSEKAYIGRLQSGAFEENSSVVLVFGENGCVVDAFEAQMPEIVTGIKGLEPAPTIVYRNGVETSIQELTEKAMAINCPTLSTAFFYDTYVSGIVNAVLPSVDDPQSITLSGKSYSLGGNVQKQFANKSIFESGDFLTIYLGSTGCVEKAEKADVFDEEIYKEMGVSYDTLVSQTLKGPEVVQGDLWRSKLGFSADEARYYLNGKEVDITAVADYDVIYYSTAFKTVWIVSDSVTGILESIKPDTLAPTAVTVAGRDYPVETSSAAMSFAGKGEFAVGDTVTLILGKTGVVQALGGAVALRDFIGLATELSYKEYTAADRTTKESYFITVEAFDGKTHVIPTDNKYMDLLVPVVVSYSSGKAQIKKIYTKYSDISDLTSAIKNGKIASDAVIVDCYGKKYTRIYEGRLRELSLTASKVMYYTFDADGNINYLILKDATGELHTYGIMLSAGGSYNYISSKGRGIGSFLTSPLGMVQVKYNNSDEADDIVQLASRDVTSIEGNNVINGKNSNKLWDYVECYVMEQRSYSIASTSGDTIDKVIRSCSLDYIKSLVVGNEYNVKCGVDSTGVVRVLVAQKK